MTDYTCTHTHVNNNHIKNLRNEKHEQDNVKVKHDLGL